MNRHEAPAYAPPRTFLSVNGVAELLGISRDTVYRLVRSGELVPYRVGERFRFRLEEIDAYLERRRDPVP